MESYAYSRIERHFLEGGIVVTSSKIRQLLELFAHKEIAKYCMYLSFVLTIGSILYVMFQRNSKMFHDVVGKTEVVVIK